MEGAALRQILTKEDCEKILTKISSNPSKLVNYKIVKFADQVVGYLGDHFRLTLEFSNETAPNNIQQVTCFLKTVPQFNQNQRDYVKAMGVFRKEVLVYKNILSELLKISKFGPQCFFVKLDEYLVLEDLTSRGFQSVERNYFDFDHAAALMRTLGKFHASSLIYEEKRSKNGKKFRIGEEFKEEVREGSYSFVEGHPRQKWCVTVVKCVSDCIKLLPDLPNVNEICEKFEKFVFEELPDLIKPSKIFRNVLTHDDLWCNNMVFNRDLECLLIDFQLVRYTPPAADVLIALLLNVEAKFLEKNYQRFIDIYYESLSDQVQRYNLDVNSIFPKVSLIESLNYYKCVALVECVMYGSHVYISEELSKIVVADLESFNEFCFLNRSKYITKELQESKQFRNRFLNVLTPLVLILADR